MHGSQVTGKTHSKSDVDIAVFRNTENNFDLLELILDLKIYFKTEKIDLTDITHADPLLLFSVVTRGKLISGKVDEFERLQETAFFKHSDYVYFLKTLSPDFVGEYSITN
jgi:predicted nucleotidyltransferase